jgi:hypothetical protein
METSEPRNLEDLYPRREFVRRDYSGTYSGTTLYTPFSDLANHSKRACHLLERNGWFSSELDEPAAIDGQVYTSTIAFERADGTVVVVAFKGDHRSCEPIPISDLWVSDPQINDSELAALFGAAFLHVDPVPINEEVPF